MSRYFRQVETIVRVTVQKQPGKFFTVSGVTSNVDTQTDGRRHRGIIPSVHQMDKSYSSPMHQMCRSSIPYTSSVK